MLCFEKVQVEQAIKEQMKLDAREWEESRRIAEKFPIFWPSEISKGSKTDEQCLKNENAIRTPSPAGIRFQNNPDTMVLADFSLGRRDGLQTKKTIHKSPKLDFFKTHMVVKTDSAVCFKCLRGELAPTKLAEIHLSPRAARLPAREALSASPH